MSLLNEMLHDLSKKKTVDKVYRPPLTTSLSQSRPAGLNKYLIAVLGFVFVLVLMLVFKYYVTNLKRNPQDGLAMPAQNKVEKSALASKDGLIKSQQSMQDFSVEMKTVLVAINKDYIKDDKSLLQGILRKEPGNIKARIQMAEIYLSQAHYSTALDVVNEGLEYAPENPDLYTLKAKILITKGQAKAAITLLTSDHPSIVNHPDFYATLASALVFDGKIAEAGTYYKSLIKLDPNNGRYWLGYGISLEHAEQLVEAKAAYQRASQNMDTKLNIRKQASLRLKTLHA